MSLSPAPSIKIRPEEITLYSHVRSGSLHGIVTHIDLESKELTICRLLSGRVSYLSLKDFVRKYHQLELLSYYLPILSEAKILQNIQEIAERAVVDGDDNNLRDRLESELVRQCIYGDVMRKEPLLCIVVAFVLMLIIAFLGDTSVLTHDAVTYAWLAVVGLTALGLVVLICIPRKIIHIELDQDLIERPLVFLRDLVVGSHIARLMSIGTKHHGIVYQINSYDLQRIYIAHNTKTLMNPGNWIRKQHHTIVIVTLKEFLDRHQDLWLVEYPGEKSLDSSVIVERILQIVNDSKMNHYDLFGNNCEIFVLYCKYGWYAKHLPHQITRYAKSPIWFLIVFIPSVLLLIYLYVSTGQNQALVLMLLCVCMVIWALMQIRSGKSGRAFVENQINMDRNDTELEHDRLGLLRDESHVEIG